MSEFKRLTYRDEKGKAWATLKTDCSAEERMSFGRQSLNRLAAYEDLGTVEELAKLIEADRWIPISERLPEPETNVLIWQFYKEDAPYSSITIGHLHQERDFRRKPYWTWIAHGADMVHPKIEAHHRADYICPGSEFVTHWRPLPQPPK